MIPPSLPCSALNAGDLITVSVAIAHNSSSTTAAQQVLITLSLPYALVPVVESLRWTGGPNTVAVLATASDDLSTVTLLLHNGLALPGSGDLPFVITFQLMLNVSIQPSVPFNGSQAFQWTTAPADTMPAVWRTYYGSGVPNPLFQLTSRAMPAIGSLQQLSTSLSLPYPQLSIGEHTVFSLHSELIQGTTAGVQLRVTMPTAADGTTLLFDVLSAEAAVWLVSGGSGSNVLTVAPGQVLFLEADVEIQGLSALAQLAVDLVPLSQSGVAATLQLTGSASKQAPRARRWRRFSGPPMRCATSTCRPLALRCSPVTARTCGLAGSTRAPTARQRPAAGSRSRSSRRPCSSAPFRPMRRPRCRCVCRWPCWTTLRLWPGAHRAVPAR